MIIANTISAAWEKSIKTLLIKGKWVPTQRGFRALEICSFQMQIMQPLKPPRISKKYDYDDDFLTQYVNSHEINFSEDSVKDRFYEYGEQRINQIEKVIETIKKEQFSRRAIVSTIIPEFDFNTYHPPCVVYLQFLLREGKLNLIAVLRSNDAWLAALPDIISLTNLQKTVSHRLNVEAGSYTHIAGSYHIYETDYPFVVEKFPI